MKAFLKSIAVVFWLAIVIFVFSAVIPKATQGSLTLSEKISTPPFAEMKSSYIDYLFLGHKGFYDDFIYLWTLQILIDPDVKNQDPDQLMQMLRTIIQHEPKMEAFYMLSCFVMSGELKKPEHCLEISLAGLKAFPLSWRIPMTQGYVNSLVLNQPAQASAFFALAASRGDRSPPWVEKLARRLANKENITEQDLNETIDFMSQVDGGEGFSDFFKKARETWQKNTDEQNKSQEEPQNEGQ